MQAQKSFMSTKSPLNQHATYSRIQNTSKRRTASNNSWYDRKRWLWAKFASYSGKYARYNRAIDRQNLDLKLFLRVRPGLSRVLCARAANWSCSRFIRLFCTVQVEQLLGSTLWKWPLTLSFVCTSYLDEAVLDLILFSFFSPQPFSLHRKKFEKCHLMKHPNIMKSRLQCLFSFLF